MSEFDQVIAGLENKGFRPHRISQGKGFAFTTAICHGGDNRTALLIYENPGERWKATCRSHHCESAGKDFYDRIRQAAGIQPGDENTPRPEPATRAPKKQSNTLGAVKRVLSMAAPWPTNERHPANRWIAQRRLWPAGIKLPLLWLDKGHITGEFSGAGAIVAKLQDPRDRKAEVQAIQLIYIDQEGNRAIHRSEQQIHDAMPGVNKRSYGNVTGRCFFLRGRLRPDSIMVVEGVADALSLYRHTPHLQKIVLGLIGTAGFRSEEIVNFIKSSGMSLFIYCDRDSAGMAAGWALRRKVGFGKVLRPQEFTGKDAAEMYALGFGEWEEFEDEQLKEKVDVGVSKIWR